MAFVPSNDKERARERGRDGKEKRKERGEGVFARRVNAREGREGKG